MNNRNKDNEEVEGSFEGANTVDITGAFEKVVIKTWLKSRIEVRASSGSFVYVRKNEPTVVLVVSPEPEEEPEVVISSKESMPGITAGGDVIFKTSSGSQIAIGNNIRQSSGSTFIPRYYGEVMVTVPEGATIMLHDVNPSGIEGFGCKVKVIIDN